MKMTFKEALIEEITRHPQNDLTNEVLMGKAENELQEILTNLHLSKIFKGIKEERDGVVIAR